MNSELFNRLLHPAYYNFIVDISFDVLDLSLFLIDIVFSSQDMFTFQVRFPTVNWNTVDY